MSARSLKKTYLQIPPAPAPLTHPQKIVARLAGTVLSPVYWLLAHQYRTPGLGFHLACTRLGLRLLLNRKAPLSYRWIYHLIFSPIVLTRYFEFDFMWHALSASCIRRYLDVSSPFMFPTLLLSQRRELTAELINPDKNDLALTASVIRASGFADRCRSHNCLIGAAPFEPESFDAITSISVVEHIPQDTQAIQKMWGLLKPGGQLLLSMPCAAEGYELYTNLDHYGLLETDEKGFTFLEFIYDEQLLQERIFSAIGRPKRFAIYGEKRGDFLRRQLLDRWSGHYWRYWREPYLMGREFRSFERLADLPGEGVLAMEFVKP